MRPPRKRKPLPLSNAVQRDRSFGGGTAKGSLVGASASASDRKGIFRKAERQDGRNPTGEGKRGTPAIVEPNGACWSLLQQEPGYRTKQRCFTVPKAPTGAAMPRPEPGTGRNGNVSSWNRGIHGAETLRQESEQGSPIEVSLRWELPNRSTKEAESLGARRTDRDSGGWW